jgi:hypothetical protein
MALEQIFALIADQKQRLGNVLVADPVFELS